MQVIRINIFFVLLLLSNVIYTQEDNSWQVYDDTEVAEIRITVDSNFLTWIYNNPNSDSTAPATVFFKNKYINQTIDSVGFRLRGKTSRGSQKKSFKLSFNSYKKGSKFYNLEKLNLNGEHNDPSITRSKLCWDIIEQTGLASTRAAHAALYINDNYMGLYVSVEHIDENFISKNFEDASGNLWKCLYLADLVDYSSDYNDYKPGNKYNTYYELKTNEKQDDYSKLMKLISLCNSNIYNNEYFRKNIEQIFDVESFLKYSAIDVILASWDDYWALGNNYYLYYEPSKDKIFWIPYDYDNTFGVDFFNIDWATANPYNYPQAVGGNRPLTSRILDIPEYRNLYSHYLQFFNESLFTNTLLDPKVDRLYSLIKDYAKKDTYRTLDWGFSLDDFTNSFTKFKDNSDYIIINYGIKEFIETRHNTLASQIKYLDSPPSLYSLHWYPQNPTNKDSIYISVSAFDNDGIDKLEVISIDENGNSYKTISMKHTPPHSNLVNNADLWSGVIPPTKDKTNIEFVIFAVDTKQNETSYPYNGKFTINITEKNAEGVLINELLAKNNNTNKDANDNFSDWVELYNNSNYNVNLSGKYLSDNPDSLTKWMFPQNSIIKSKSYMLLWCNGNSKLQNETNFKLSSKGESLLLSDSDGTTIIDSVTFGKQLSDISFGRYPNGENSWQNMTPTPLAENGNLTDVKELPIAEKIKLLQNYPNPFNPSTTISYQIPSELFVNLSVFDVMGRMVATIVNRKQSAGIYKSTFNANNLASGVYFYRLKIGSNQITKKMLLLR